MGAKAARRSLSDAYGQAVWSWRPDAGVKFVDDFHGDGGYKPVHRGEHGAAVKTIAQGMPDCRLPCGCLRAQSAHSSARKARGCGLHPAFPAPSIAEGDLEAKGRARSRRGDEKPCLRGFA